jgi:hypothetical protein
MSSDLVILFGLSFPKAKDDTNSLPEAEESSPAVSAKIWFI